MCTKAVSRVPTYSEIRWASTIGISAMNQIHNSIEYGLPSRHTFVVTPIGATIEHAKIISADFRLDIARPEIRVYQARFYASITGL